MAGFQVYLSVIADRIEGPEMLIQNMFEGIFI